MKKLILLAMLAVGALVLSSTSEAKANHRGGCGPGFGGGGYYGGFSYAPRYFAPSYYAPSYYAPSYYTPAYRYFNGPVNSFGYAYPTTGFYYGNPGFSISVGSGYRSNYSVGGFGAGRSYYPGAY